MDSANIGKQNSVKVFATFDVKFPVELQNALSVNLLFFQGWRAQFHKGLHLKNAQYLRRMNVEGNLSLVLAVILFPRSGTDQAKCLKIDNLSVFSCDFAKWKF